MGKKERKDATNTMPGVPCDERSAEPAGDVPVNMSKQEIIACLRNAQKKRTRDYDELTVAVLREAAHSNDRDLYGEAVAAVHLSLRPYENHFLITNFGLYTNSRDYEDYIQVLGEAITKELRHWDPCRGKLSTFFAPRFKKACLVFKNCGQSTMASMHYETVYMDIKKARANLEQKGIVDPSPLELRNEIALFKRAHSVQTIIKCLEMAKDVSSLDACGEFVDRTSVNPLEHVLQNEVSEQVDEVIDSMEPQYRVVLRALFNYMQDGTGDKMTNEELRERVMDYTGPVSEEWIRNVRQSAEADFRRRIRRKHLYEPRKSAKKKNEFHELGSIADDADILAALQNNADDLFPD